MSLRRAVGWSVGWTLLGVGFAGFLWWWQGRAPAEEYLAGFLIEKSLSVDNLFVFAADLRLLRRARRVPARVLFWGIVGAIVLRAIFILAGAALLDAFHCDDLRLRRVPRRHRHPDGPPRRRRDPPRAEPAAAAAAPRRADARPTTTASGCSSRERRARLATPLLVALVLVATFDVVFAVDSIPAIFAVTRETFIVFAANAFSLLGLGALYFVLAGHDRPLPLPQPRPRRQCSSSSA